MYTDRAIKANSLIAPGMVGYDPTFQSKTYKYNPEEGKKQLSLAKQLWKKQGFSDEKIKKMLTIRYGVHPSSFLKKLFYLYSKYLKKIGITLVPVYIYWPKMLAAIKKGTLFLMVDNASWATNLRFAAPEIKKTLSSEPEFKNIKKIKYFINPLARKKATRRKKKAKESQQEAAKLKELAFKLKDNKYAKTR